MTPTGSNQLRVAEVTYVAITGGFVYVAVILDAWSRRVVGYAIDPRSGSVCLNSFGAADKWFAPLVTPPPGLVAAH